MITKFIKRILRRDPMAKHTQANHTGAPKRIPKKTHRIDTHLLCNKLVMKRLLLEVRYVI